jgi:hypothetical protein
LRTSNFYRNPFDVDRRAFPEAPQERGDQLLKQEKFADFYLLNLTGGKSWRISGRLSVSLRASTTYSTNCTKPADTSKPETPTTARLTKMFQAEHHHSPLNISTVTEELIS